MEGLLTWPGNLTTPGPAGTNRKNYWWLFPGWVCSPAARPHPRRESANDRTRVGSDPECVCHDAPNTENRVEWRLSPASRCRRPTNQPTTSILARSPCWWSRKTDPDAGHRGITLLMVRAGARSAILSGAAPNSSTENPGMTKAQTRTQTTRRTVLEGRRLSGPRPPNVWWGARDAAFLNHLNEGAGLMNVSPCAVTPASTTVHGARFPGA